MINSKKVIAGLGVVAGLGVAMLPLASYAAEAKSGEQVVRAQIDEVFTMTVTSSVDIKSNNTTAVTLNKNSINNELIHTIEVAGNIYGGYDLTMSSSTAETSLLYVKDSSKEFGTAARYDSDTKIETKTGVAVGTSAWAYKKKVNGGSYDSTYNTIKAVSSPDALYTNTNAAGSFDDTVLVQFGISTAEAQAAGSYEGQVIYKATPKI